MYRYIFFIFVLLSSVFTDVYVLAEEIPSGEDFKKDKIISVLQRSIEVIKYEIQRDQEVASRKMRIPGLRQLRLKLKEDIVAKEKSINSLKSFLSSTLPNEIVSLQKTLDQEKKIVQSIQISSRAKKQTRFIIKNSIPAKVDILASLEKVLLGFK